MRAEDEPKVHSEVVGRVMDRHLVAADRPISEVVNETLYWERERLRKAKDSAEEKAFVAELRRSLPHAGESDLRSLLRRIIERYVGEVCGHFDDRVYRAATSVLPVALTGLLNGMSLPRLMRGLGDRRSLSDHLVVQGEIDTLKRVWQEGTVVLAPTHSSNLDSIVLGYSVFQLGLPPVTYGAGLNLFENRFMGFFMRNLGAYTVDRRKRDPLYKEILKEYATFALELGYPSLFFPGGTRSRSGHVEKRLKLGLMGATLTAFSNNLRADKPRPGVFVVPVTLSYPLVLEAATLIDDHLQREGRARYIIVDDEFSRMRRWVDFVRGLVNLDQSIYVTFGRPLDTMGNDVDADGRSHGPTGREVDPKRYLLVDGEVRPDRVRDAEYTRHVAERVVDGFHDENVALSTNVLAFALFERLRRDSREGDLYRFLRDLDSERSLPIAEAEAEVGRVLDGLKALAGQGRVRAGLDVATWDAADVTRAALRTFGTYHTTPVVERRGVRLHVGDANLLYYYRNRLEGYGLAGTAARQRAVGAR